MHSPDYINVYALAWLINVYHSPVCTKCMHSHDYINVYALAWLYYVYAPPDYINVYHSSDIFNICDRIARIIF